MKVYCIESFKTQFQKLAKKNSYRDLQALLINNCLQDYETFRKGRVVRMNTNIQRPYIKKYLGGSGGFRLYCHAFVVEKKLYLLFVYPKTGSMGKNSISKNDEKELSIELKEAIKTDDLYFLKNEEGKIIFKHMSKCPPNRST